MKVRQLVKATLNTLLDKQQKLKVVSVNTGSFTLANNASVWKSITINESGYKVVGIVGFYNNGGASTYLYAWYKTGDTGITSAIYNASGSSKTMTITFHVLLEKLGGVLTNIVSYIAHLFGRRCAYVN